MSRRVERSIWSNGLRRRSARISALDQQEDKAGQQLEEGSAGVKRKHRQEGIENQYQKDHSSTNDEKVVTDAKEKGMCDKGKYPFLPDKHLLELVLDVLQRRDTHEIFAEPVDPQEVEGYYEIVKEPMDFGTMRAKLHEGMYSNLEEFEHDAFLIPRNALLFNSTGSVYFRQARAIDDLAKKVFHVLKTNPKKLESEFSGTRRRSSRRIQEVKALKIYPRPELATNVASNDTDNRFSSNGEKYSENRPYLSKSIKDNIILSCKAPCIGAEGSEFFTAAKFGRRLDNIEVDRRSTYDPPRPFDLGTGSMVSTMPGGPRFLCHVNQDDISYSESLMKFAKGLGPVAQMVAKRKLQGFTNLHQKHETIRAPIDLNNSISSNCSGNEVFKRHITESNSPTHGVERLDQSGIKLTKVENPVFRNGLRSSFTRGFPNFRPNDVYKQGAGVEARSNNPFAFNISFLKSRLNQMNQVLGGCVDGSSSGEMSTKRASFGYQQFVNSGQESSVLRESSAPNSSDGNLGLNL